MSGNPNTTNSSSNSLLSFLKTWWPYIVALLPVMIFRDFSPRNELRYLTIVDEALSSGSFWTFTFEGEPYADKPPLYFWLIMLQRWLFGTHVPAVICLFSLIPALGILGIMERWTRNSFQTVAESRFVQLILATLGLQLGMAVFARMDMLMSLFIIWALWLYWRSGQEERPHRWGFGILLFLALFSKGPFGILIPLLVTLVWALVSNTWRLWLKMWSWRTWLAIIVGCTVWFGNVYLEGGADYLNNMLFHQTVDRAVNAFHHQRPWWFYLVHLWYTALPWGPLCIVGIGSWLWQFFKTKGHNKRCTSLFAATDLHAFFCLSFLTTLVMLSCVSGKLDVYLLPAYPMLAYGGMLQVLQWKKFTTSWRNGLVRACQVLLLIIFVAGLLLPFYQQYIS